MPTDQNVQHDKKLYMSYKSGIKIEIYENI